MSQHRDWHEFPQWRAQDLSLAVPGLGADGLDLLAVSFLQKTKSVALPSVSNISVKALRDGNIALVVSLVPIL